MFFPVAGCQQDNRYMAGLQITFQLLAHFQSGHDRHHDVTYNHLRLQRRSPFQSFLPVGSRIYLIYLFKNLRQYFTHFRVIFYNQYFHRFIRLHHFRDFLRLYYIMFGNVLVCGGRGFHIHIRIPVESNGKRGNSIQFAFHSDGSLMQLYNSFRHRQSNARSFDSSCGCCRIILPKPFKYMFDLGFINAYPQVVD